MNLLLAVTMVAWSLSPPPFQHAHEGGADLSHHHRHADVDDDEVADFDLAHHHGDAEHSHREVTSPSALAGLASHLHFDWLGFRLTLSDEQSSTEKGDDPSGPKLLFVQAQPCRVDGQRLHSVRSFDPLLTLLDPNAWAAGNMASCSIASSRPGGTVPPLCDRARHERSGVLLA